MKKANLEKYKMFGGKVTILQLMATIGIVAFVVTVIATIAIH